MIMVMEGREKLCIIIIMIVQIIHGVKISLCRRGHYNIIAAH